MERNKMILNNIEQVDKKVCTGCGLCVEICPKKTINMQEDEEGFIAPVVNNHFCINCGLCLRLCPTTEAVENIFFKNEREYFCGFISDKKTLLNSSSGGVFNVLANHILSQGGYICGCVYNSEMQAVHIIINKREDLELMHGSKYVQSRVNQCFGDIKDLLLNGHRVMFVGTGCQVAALRLFLKVEYENLFCVEILCHGVPSPKLFSEYLKYLEKKLKGKVKNIQFRNKEKRGWGSEHRTCIIYEKKGEIKKYRPILPAYFSAFFYSLNLRESCYKCRFAQLERVGDLTIGDFWGYWEKYKKRIVEGISVVSINSKKGKILVNSIKDKFEFYESLSQKEAIKSNDNFEHPTKRPFERDGFYKGVFNKGYKDLWKKVYLSKSCRKKTIVSIYGALVPAKIRFIINKLRKK